MVEVLAALLELGEGRRRLAGEQIQAHEAGVRLLKQRAGLDKGACVADRSIELLEPGGVIAQQLERLGHTTLDAGAFAKQPEVELGRAGKMQPIQQWAAHQCDGSGKIGCGAKARVAPQVRLKAAQIEPVCLGIERHLPVAAAQNCWAKLAADTGKQQA
jgi:hypothetical protein